jgi:hypothetical protein
MEIVFIILGFMGYAAFIGLAIYVACRLANEADVNDENF